MARREFQHVARSGGVGDKERRIAGTARLDHVRHVAPGLGRDRGQDLAHGKSGTGAEVEGAALVPLQQQLQRCDMGGGEIDDVDIVADRGAVRRCVIGAEHGEIRKMAL